MTQRLVLPGSVYQHACTWLLHVIGDLTLWQLSLKGEHPESKYSRRIRKTAQHFMTYSEKSHSAGQVTELVQAGPRLARFEGEDVNLLSLGGVSDVCCFCFVLFLTDMEG